MSRARLQEHLAIAERHVTAGEQVVNRQRDLVGELEREGLPTGRAIELLKTFERTQTELVADRDRLRRQLATLDG